MTRAEFLEFLAALQAHCKGYLTEKPHASMLPILEVPVLEAGTKEIGTIVVGLDGMPATHQERAAFLFTVGKGLAEECLKECLLPAGVVHFSEAWTVARKQREPWVDASTAPDRREVIIMAAIYFDGVTHGGVHFMASLSFTRDALGMIVPGAWGTLREGSENNLLIAWWQGFVKGSQAFMQQIRESN